MEQESTRAKERLVARIEVVIDLKASETESKNFVTCVLDN